MPKAKPLTKTAEQYLDLFEHYLKEGWGVSLARHKAGLTTSLGDRLVMQDKRFEAMAAPYRRRKNGHTKRNKIQDQS